MGSLLNQDDKIKSIGALQDFLFACNKEHGPMTVQIDVLFKKGRQLAFSCSPSIVIGFDSNFTKISIVWEDAGYTQDEFKEMSLYGVYYPDFVKMKYLKTKKILEINSSDSNKIIRIYAKNPSN